MSLLGEPNTLFNVYFIGCVFFFLCVYTTAVTNVQITDAERRFDVNRSTIFGIRQQLRVYEYVLLAEKEHFNDYSWTNVGQESEI